MRDNTLFTETTSTTPIQCRLAADDDNVDKDNYYIKSSVKVQTTYSIYINNDIESNHVYPELLHKLRTISEIDIVNLYLASNGGYCDAGFQIIHAIKDCKGPVNIIVDSPCYSMGAIIAVCGDSLTFKPNTFLMFHNYSGGNHGKGKEMKQAMLESDVWIRTNFKYYCTPFLTDEEMTLLDNDQDVYVHSWDKGLTKRLARHYK